MAFKNYRVALLAALRATYAAKGAPVGSHEIFTWMQANDPSTLDDLRRLGYLDADDSARAGRWSWRVYLANALVWMHRTGQITLTGHTTETPPGYFNRVGLWRP